MLEPKVKEKTLVPTYEGLLPPVSLTIGSNILTLQANDVVFCGRILMFLAHFFPLSERSGMYLFSALVFRQRVLSLD
jgi:hypothetical protein